MKNQGNIIKCVGSTFICIVCAIAALGLVGLSNAHGHGMTTGDRNVVMFLSSVSVVAFVYVLIFLKRIITP